MIEAYTSATAIFTELGESMTFLPYPMRSIVISALVLVGTILFISLVKKIIEAVL